MDDLGVHHLNLAFNKGAQSNEQPRKMGTVLTCEYGTGTDVPPP